MARLLTAKRLRELLSYNPRTGVFTWRITGWGPYIRPGAIAGASRKDGRCVIRIDQQLYLGSRLAFLWMTGSFPRQSLDHINGNPSDDRWRNLREANHSQNGGNQRVQTHKLYSPLKGVTCDKRDGIYQAAIWFQQRRIHLGRFRTPEDAHLAYRKAARKYFGEFARFS